MPAAFADAFRLRTLGTAVLERQREASWETALRAGKPLALLIFLSAAEGRAVSREALADLLWGDESPENARASLRQALYGLRQILGEDRLRTDRETATLVAGAVACDRTTLITAARAGRLDELVDVAQGPFAELALADGASEFERWAAAERQRLEDLVVSQAAATVPARVAAGDIAAARGPAVQLLTRFPDRSELAVVAFDALVAAGALDEAAERLEAHAARLSLRDLPLPDDVRDRVSRVRRRTPSPATVEPGGLFAVGQTCVGRDALLRDLQGEAEGAAAGRPRRLLLVGPAGVGKTRVLDEFEARLRLRGARVVRVGFLPGSADVEFAALIEVVRALSALPGALGVAEQSARRLLAIAPELAERFPGAAARGALTAPGLQGLPEALNDLLSAVAEDRLVVLMLDNMHAGDGSSLRVFAASTFRRGMRLLAVGTSRLAPDAGLTAGTVVMDVRPLGGDDVRTLLASVAPLPNAPWMDALVTTLLERSLGIAQVALAAVRSLGAAGLLRVEDGRWHCDDPGALLAAARESAGTGWMVEALDARARELLELLAAWGRPLDERDLVGTLGLAGSGWSAGAVRQALRRLEALGLIQSRDTTWVLAHDNVAEELRRVAAPVSSPSPVDLLLRHWSQEGRLTVEVLDHLAWIAGRDTTRRQLRALVKVAARSRALRAAGLQGAELAAHVARASGLPMAEAELRRSLGFWARLSERVRVAAAVGLTLAALGAFWLLERLQPRLVVELQPMVEAPNELQSFAVQPRVRVENGFARVYRSAYPIRARVDYGSLYGDTAQRLQDGRAQFERLVWRRGTPSAESHPVHLVVEGPWYVRRGAAAILGASSGELVDKFRLLSLRANGVDITDTMAVDVGARDSLRFDMTFEYTTIGATSNYIVAAAAMWEPREAAAIRLAGLPRPVEAGRRTVSFRVEAPPAVGEHFVVVLFDAEDTAEHMLSASNWKSGAPRWFDGNDIQDQPRSFFRQLRSDGRAEVRQYTWGDRLPRQGDLRYGDSLFISARDMTEVAPVTKRVTGRAILVRRR